MFCILSISILTFLTFFNNDHKLNPQSRVPADSLVLGIGQQPQWSKGPQGKIRITYGRNDSIFCATYQSADKKFTVPEYVGRVNGMHLGMTRGPQIASSAKSSVITAMDKEGNIRSFVYSEATGKWREGPVVNDTAGTAPEGLTAIAADDQNNYYAVWLDVRKDDKNNVYFSSFSLEDGKWSKNKLVYASPDEHVCECCKPSIAVAGNHVAIMFRNWLNGSRDLYISESYNKGSSFNPALKLGTGTWKLNGCPMDGGGVAIDKNGVAQTVWQREGVVYTCTPKKPEVMIGKGRSCAISTGNGKLIASMQQNGVVKMVDLETRNEVVLGKGTFLQTLTTDNGNVMAAWERDGQIFVRILHSVSVARI